MSGEISRGLLDTNIIILRGAISASDLPEEMAISAVTLAELSAGVNSVPGDSEDAVRERARRVAILQRTEREFDPLPFDAAAARIYGQLASALLTIGRTSRRRVADLMIASIAAAQGMALYTTNPRDYEGLDEYVQVIRLLVQECQRTCPPDKGKWTYSLKYHRAVVLRCATSSTVSLLRL